MKKQEVEERFFKLLYGNLEPEEEEMIISDLEKAGIAREEINSMISVDRLLESAPLPEPSEKMDKRFYAMIEEEKRNELLGNPEKRHYNSFMNVVLTPGIRIAAGISLFLLGWFASGWFAPTKVNNAQLSILTTEVSNLKETLVLSMMKQSSSVERIKAVNMVSDFDNADSPVIESLLGVLNHDSNDNVRLLALEALMRYSTFPEVREGLIASITNQNSPMIQMRLAEIMLALKEKRSVPEFQKVLMNTNLNYIVKDRINEAVVTLL